MELRRWGQGWCVSAVLLEPGTEQAAVAALRQREKWKQALKCATFLILLQKYKNTSFLYFYNDLDPQSKANYSFHMTLRTSLQAFMHWGGLSNVHLSDADGDCCLRSCECCWYWKQCFPFLNLLKLKEPPIMLPHTLLCFQHRSWEIIPLSKLLEIQMLAVI